MKQKRIPFERNLKSENDKIVCDFCGANDTKANPIITGDNACICKACVGLCYDIMNTQLDDISIKSETKIKPEELKIKTPSELKAILDEYVIGQERAKKGSISCCL